jgi:hypothetical protein
MADRSGQVVIPPSGKIQISTGLPRTVAPDQFVQFLSVQNNGNNNMRLSDVSVSATRGIVLYPSGAGSQQVTSAFIYSTMISDWWVQGTPGDTADYIFIP